MGLNELPAFCPRPPLCPAAYPHVGTSLWAVWCNEGECHRVATSLPLPLWQASGLAPPGPVEDAQLLTGDSAGGLAPPLLVWKEKQQQGGVAVHASSFVAALLSSVFWGWEWRWGGKHEVVWLADGIVVVGRHREVH